MTNFKNLLFTLIFLTPIAAFSGEHTAPASVEGAKIIDAAEAKKLFDEGTAVFVDARQDSAYEEGRIPGAIHLDVKIKGTYDQKNLEKNLPDKNATIVAYCNGEKCTRASMASAFFVSAGYSNVRYFRTGFPGWSAAGNPIE